MVDTVVGTNSPSYTPVTADVAANIYCRVTATNAAGSANATSNSVGPVTAAGGGGATTTFDPANKAADITLSDGNLTAANGATTRAGVRTIASASSGKKYAELLITTISNPGSNVFGIANAAVALTDFPGADLNGAGMACDGILYINNTGASVLNPGYTAGDVMCLAVDFAAGKIWIRKNAGPGWSTTGGATGTGDPTDPSTGTSLSSLNAGPFYLFVSMTSSGDTVTANFGPTYTHTPPTGYIDFEVTHA